MVDAGVVAVAAVVPRRARITLPVAAARIGVPAGTAMSMPSCIRPQRGPNGEVTGPLTGQMKPLAPPWIGPAGSVAVPSRLAAWICAWMSSWMSEMSPSSCSMLSSTESSDGGLARRGPRRARPRGPRAGRGCARARPPSRRSRRASASIRVDRVARCRRAGSRTRPTIARVLLLDSLQVLVALEQVVEAVGLEDHGEHVGLVGLVDRDQPLAQHLERAAQVRLRARRARCFSARAAPCTSVELLPRRSPRGCAARRPRRRAGRSGRCTRRSRSSARPSAPSPRSSSASLSSSLLSRSWPRAPAAQSDEGEACRGRRQRRTAHECSDSGSRPSSPHAGSPPRGPCASDR